MPRPGIDRDRDRPGSPSRPADQRIDHVHRQVVHRLVAEIFQAFEGGGRPAPDMPVTTTTGRLRGGPVGRSVAPSWAGSSLADPSAVEAVSVIDPSVTGMIMMGPVPAPANRPTAWMLPAATWPG